MFLLYLHLAKSEYHMSLRHCYSILTCTRYSIRVGRSRSATGPFVDRNGVDLKNGGGYIVYGSHDYVVSSEPPRCMSSMS
jgi:beta-xylosidase